MADFGGMSADQINASMGFGPGGVGAGGQSQLNNIFGNFGQQTDYYSGLGAAYGRNVGEPSGMGSVFDQSAYGMQPQAPYQSYGQPALPSGGGGGVYRSAPGGGLYLDQGGDNPPTNASPSSQGLLGYTPSQPGAQLPNGFGYPGAMPPSQMFNPNTYAPPQQQSSFGGGLTPKTAGYDDSWMRGGAAPAALTPASEMQYYNSQWNYDKPMDQTPQSVFGHPGTQDYNVIDPKQLPSRQNSSGEVGAQAMLQPQVMEGRS
jgi:hypothetical protein